MEDEVMIEIPVSREAAEALGDPSKRRRVGALVSRILRPGTPDRDPLAALISEIKREAGAAGLTDEEIEAELAIYNAERRL